MKKPALFLCLLFPLLLFSQKKYGQDRIDSLLERLPQTHKDTNKVKLLDNISFTYSTINPAEGIKYAERAKRLSEELKWKKGMASAYSDLGINYEAQSEHAKAIENNLKALKLYEELGMRSSMSGVLANISQVYLARSDYTKALEYSFKALAINDEFPKEKSSAIIRENIGLIYLEQKKYAKAMDYFSQALEIHDSIHNEKGAARVLGNMGIIYDAQGEYAKALTCYLRALKTNETQGNKNSIQINLANIGNAYAHLGDFSQALVYHRKALRISQELGMKSDIAVNLGNIGETYFFIANDSVKPIKADSLVPADRAAVLDKAIFYLLEATAICKEISFSGPLIEFEQFLSNAYRLAGNYKKAYETFVSYTSLKDSVFSAESKLKFKSFEAKHALDLKDKEIIIQNKQIENAKLAISNKRNERLAFIAGIVVLLLALAIVINRFIRRNKLQEDTLSDIARIQSHQLRGPVARILGLTSMLSKNGTEVQENKELIRHLNAATEELDAVVKKIVKKTKTE